MPGVSEEGEDDLSEWEESVATFVEAHLPNPASRVLDVGCGNGWLTHRLDERGHAVKGIDPEAPEGSQFDRVPLDAFLDSDPYDAVVAVLSLHHMPDLKAAVRKLREHLRAGGSLVVVEFAWDRIDDATAAWCLERLPAEADAHNWLHDRCGELGERLQGGRPLEAEERFRLWADEEGFHSSATMLTQLRRRFSERAFRWSPYLFPDLEGVTEAEERDAIEAGTIRAVGFRFVGERRP